MTDKLPPLPETTVSTAYHIDGCGEPAYTPEEMQEYARQAVREAVPEGFVLVPVEPTEAMLQAALDCQDADPEDGPASEVYYGYKAMLAAAKEAK